MGTVYRKTVTKPLPPNAEIVTRKGKRVAKWKDAKGKSRTEPVTTPKKGKYAGQDRLVITARTFTAKYRDGNGHVVEVATGCRDETAARQVLADLERRAERVRANVVTSVCRPARCQPIIRTKRVLLPAHDCQAIWLP